LGTAMFHEVKLAADACAVGVRRVP